MINRLRYCISIQTFSRKMCTWIVIGTLLIMTGCGVRETATSQVPATSVEGGPPTVVQEVRPTPVRGIDDTFNGIKGIQIANVWRGPVDGIWFNIHEDERTQGCSTFVL